MMLSIVVLSVCGIDIACRGLAGRTAGVSAQAAAVDAGWLDTAPTPHTASSIQQQHSTNGRVSFRHLVCLSTPVLIAPRASSFTLPSQSDLAQASNVVEQAAVPSQEVVNESAEASKGVDELISDGNAATAAGKHAEACEHFAFAVEKLCVCPCGQPGRVPLDASVRAGGLSTRVDHCRLLH